MSQPKRVLDQELLDEFPNLSADNHEVTSEKDINYNCISFALGITDRCFWPVRSAFTRYKWPDTVPREETLEAFILAFELFGYTVCEDGNAELEEGIEKVALFTKSESDTTPTHAARQTESGVWKSKLGRDEDIEHAALEAVSGDGYGVVSKILKRPRLPAST